MVKYGLHFDPQEPHVFFESVKDVIVTQYRNEDRAVCGKGTYQLRKGFEYFLVNDLKWSSMTAVQRLNKIKEFQKADMRSQKDYVTITAPDAPQCSALSALPWKVRSLEVSIVILATMFEKANELLRHEDLTVKMSGTDGGSYIVANHKNQIYSVTSGKGGSFKCDQNCVNACAKIAWTL